MLVIDDAKLPPPSPATPATTMKVVYDVPGWAMKKTVNAVGIASTSAENIVQLRPPNLATAKVYGIRRIAPTSVGTATRKNLPAASMWYTFCGMNSTITDQIDHTEKPTCSAKIDQIRLRRAIFAPPLFQASSSSASQSSML